MFLLNEQDDAPAVFTEMGELWRSGEVEEWRETARWVKFEEDVEEGGNRWRVMPGGGQGGAGTRKVQKSWDGPNMNMEQRTNLQVQAPRGHPLPARPVPAEVSAARPRPSPSICPFAPLTLFPPPGNRSCLLNGIVLIDIEADNLPQLIGPERIFLFQS